MYPKAGTVSVLDDWTHIWELQLSDVETSAHDVREKVKTLSCSDGGVFSHIQQLFVIQEGSEGLLIDRKVKPQPFAEGMVFYVPGERNPIAFYYAGKGDKTHEGLYARRGTLKGVKLPESGLMGEERDTYKNVTVVPIGSKLCHEVIKTDEFVKVPFSEPPPPPKDVKLAHGYVGQVGYFAGDPWGVISNIDMFNPILDSKPTDPGVMNKFTSTFGVVTGPVTILSAIKTMRVAQRIGDKEGVLNSNIRLVRGGIELGNGATMIGVRAVGLAASKKTASKTILAANRVLGMISSVSGSFLYFFLMLPSFLDVIRGGKFLCGLNQKKEEGTEEAFKYLVEQVGINLDDLNGIEKVSYFETAEELYDLVKDGEELPIGFENDLTRDEMMAIEDRLNTLLATIDPKDYPLITDWGQVRDCLLAKMLKEANRVVLEKREKYTRRASHGSYTDIRAKMKNGEIRFSIFGFNCLKISDKETFMIDMVNLATKETASNIFLNSFLVFLCITGIATIIGASIFTGGAPLVACLIVMLVNNILMTGLDLYAFIEEAKALRKSSKNDLITVGIFMLLSILSLTVSMVFAQSNLARGVIIGLGVLMLSFEGAAAYDLYGKLDTEDENMPEDQLRDISWQGRGVSAKPRTSEDLNEVKALELRRRNLDYRDKLRKAGFINS